jgi:hypothetical protein
MVPTANPFPRAASGTASDSAMDAVAAIPTAIARRQAQPVPHWSRPHRRPTVWRRAAAPGVRVRAQHVTTGCPIGATPRPARGRQDGSATPGG